MSEAERLARLIRDSRGVAHKCDIAPVVARLRMDAHGDAAVGDDTAVIRHADGNLLFAIEGFVADFVAGDPWFAGYCGVMVNLSDVAAMGGRAIAVVDALWSAGEAQAAEILGGMRDAATRYGVPVVGGHSNLKADSPQLAVAVLGEADHPVTSFDARPGDALIVVTDLRGRFRDPFPWWDASTGTADAGRLRGDLALLPMLAGRNLLRAGKDISMAGVVGTAMMLAETSLVGFAIDLDCVPRPDGVTLERWLTAFPSFGFVLAVAPADTTDVLTAFAARDIAAAVAGHFTADARAVIGHAGATATVWDFAQPFIGCAPMQEVRTDA
ncbi:AIR synthase-related protein [Sphingomonas sp. SORGH_AS 950]|uniref:sll0787 family AIR synthase-like protein n=1 Tax=Sphingomonas sp. SORGH_AS_0950 TaxID=3041792 RepID=UPI002786A8C5|nr:sll0787 family AIR synthase-like protein [Sphingomonas sp. SORGH_AS_0950]MDQ1155868.1 AIR synthase-related protein [Sphingomonas sp. SORGH_AS_0950]